ncbi:MAG: hypothetical protein M1820_010219 [Bogoriella megaspora]|nr:MAG: hypothetical protein M1820_010219 [Bogoriella megaspora]
MPCVDDHQSQPTTDSPANNHVNTVTVSGGHEVQPSGTSSEPQVHERMQFNATDGAREPLTDLADARTKAQKAVAAVLVESEGLSIVKLQGSDMVG